MKFFNFSLFLGFLLLGISLSFLLLLFILGPLFASPHVIIPYSISPFDIATLYPHAWQTLKIFYLIFYFLSTLIILNSLYSILLKHISFPQKKLTYDIPKGLSLFIGIDETSHTPLFIPEYGLYQNILITGTIGSGKTSSAMYPFTEQLISSLPKLGMLILDVKGNYYKQVAHLAAKYEREEDLYVIELGGKMKYNPLHKPHLKASVLANRLKTVLSLFSTNTEDSYWLDKTEQVLENAIKLCRLYNHGYVTFQEIHKLVTADEYYKEKIVSLRKLFQTGKLSVCATYDLLSSLDFFEVEFHQIDSRTSSIIKSEVTRITAPFLSDYQVLNTFSPDETILNFPGFDEVVRSGKIVVLHMNLAEYKTLSKIMATYLKLDFQQEILSLLAKDTLISPTAFISDEFAEYVTATDSEFFAQSREAKCINIVATQSYTSLLNTLKEPHLVKSIIQNLVNKLWFRTDDTFTIEEIQKQIGKEQKKHISKSFSENAKETNYDYFSSTLKSKDSNISESISSYTHLDFVYDTSFFSQNLETFTCLAFLSDGSKITKPVKLSMRPYFEEKEVLHAP